MYEWGVIPSRLHHHHGFPCSHITRGMNKRPVGGRSSETYSHPIIINQSRICFLQLVFSEGNTSSFPRASIKISSHFVKIMPRQSCSMMRYLDTLSAVHRTEVCVWVVNTTASYARGPVFKSRPRNQVSWGFSCFFSVSPGKFWDCTLKVGYDRFLPNPFHFIRRYMVCVTENASLNGL
jgi:hypothetical protein